MRQGGGGPIAARRLRILAEVRERGEPFLRLDPARLRFQLGTSHADLRVPVELSPDAVALAARIVRPSRTTPIAPATLAAVVPPATVTAEAATSRSHVAAANPP